ncbi:MAG: CapA family protein [Alphaproteobacteria bacterium]|nr:CapA family protein [Alphaproteobacteria bacterium]
MKALLLLLLSCGPRPPVAPEAPQATEPPLPARWPGPALVSRATVVAAGDLIPHTNVHHAAAAAAARGAPQAGWSSLLAPLAPRLQAADLAFLNLETPVAPETGTGTRAFVFDAPTALLDAIVASGVDVVSHANNHVYDQGRAGLAETLRHLDATPLVHLGAGPTCAAARAARVLEVDGLRLAWLGTSKVYNDRLNAGPEETCADAFDLEATLAEVRRARADGADAVILSIHWGREYHVEPDPADVADAHALIEGGVDVILGHHPHVVQPLEAVEASDGRVGVVAYSLGNLVSNQAYGYRFGLQPHDRGRSRDGLMLAFSVVRKRYGPGPDGVPVERVSLADVHAVPLWTDNDAGVMVHPAPHIAVLATGDGIEEAYAALAEAPDEATRRTLEERIELLRVRWWSVEQVVGAGWMAPEPR